MCLGIPKKCIVDYSLKSPLMMEIKSRDHSFLYCSDLHADGASINLARLLLNDAIQSRDASDAPPAAAQMSDLDYISSQISHSQAPDANRPPIQSQRRTNRDSGSAPAVDTRQRLSVPSRLRQQGAATQSDTGLYCLCIKLSHILQF